MSKSLLLLQKILNPKNSQEMEQAPPTPVFSQDSEERKETKKPSKTTRKQRISQYVHKVNEDSLEQVMKDILEENSKLRREIESLRVANVSLKREMEELTHCLLQDRLKNQSTDLDFFN